MLNPVDKEKIQKDLNNCRDMKELFVYINAHWDLSTAKLGPFTKPKVINGFIEALNTLNPKRK
jgi:hypothetical protein